MFAFSQVQPETTGSVQDMEVPMSTYLKSSIDSAVHTDPLSQISRWSELQGAENNDQPKISAEQANKQYGMDGFKFDEPITDEAASLLADRHKVQMDNNFSLSNDNHSLLAKAAGTTVGMVASMTDPVNLALMFMPVVGEATKLGPVESASELGMLGRGGYLREKFNAGLITREELQQTIPTMPRLAESLIQGASYMSLAEGPKQMFAASEKEDVGDPFANILEGTLFAGGMHLGLNALFKLWPHIASATKVALMSKAMNDFVKGDDISVHELAGADEAVAAHQVDEANSEAPWPSSWKQEDLLSHQEAYHQNLQNIFNSALDKIQKGYDDDRAQAAREIDLLRSTHTPKGPTENPVVTETGADPRQIAFSSSLDEIRQNGAKTTAQVQALFPEVRMSRQEAAALRRQAWGEDEVKQKQQDNIKQLLDNAQQKNQPGQKALNRKKDFENMPNPFAKEKETEQAHDPVTPQDKTITPVEKQTQEIKRDVKGRFVAKAKTSDILPKQKSAFSHIPEVNKFHNTLKKLAKTNPDFRYLYHLTSVSDKQLLEEGLTSKHNFFALKDVWSGLKDKTSIKIDTLKLLHDIYPDPENFTEDFKHWSEVSKNENEIKQYLQEIQNTTPTKTGDGLFVINRPIASSEFESVTDIVSGKETKAKTSDIKAIMNEIQHEAESNKPQPKAIESAVQCAGQQII